MTESTKSRPTRRRIFVDPEVQGGLVRKLLSHWILFFVCNTLALTIWVRLFDQPSASWGQSFLDTLMRFLPFFVISLALVPAFAWDTLKLTNRFAGPMLRFRSALADARAGRKVAELRFRDSDFWAEIAENFNHIVAESETKKQSVQ